MLHIIVSLKGPETECVTLTTDDCFALAAAQDHILSV